MNTRSIPFTRGKYSSGFTLIELMIVVAIIALLAAIAIPSYRDFVVRSHRTEAKVALTELANLQEKFYSEMGSYADAFGADKAAGEVNYRDETDKWYSLEIDADGGSYTLTATALGKQFDDDPDCQEIELTHLGVRTPAACWSK